MINKRAFLYSRDGTHMLYFFIWKSAPRMISLWTCTFHTDLADLSSFGELGRKRKSDTYNKATHTPKSVTQNNKPAGAMEHAHRKTHTKITTTTPTCAQNTTEHIATQRARACLLACLPARACPPPFLLTCLPESFPACLPV